MTTYLFPEDADLFHAKAEEASISRLYGGIHYRSDNVEGLKLGRQIAKLVVERAKQGGASHWTYRAPPRRRRASSGWRC
ncbi:MAG: hypothetical protein ACRDJ4_06935 [Actinomycetota bacterium]